MLLLPFCEERSNGRNSVVQFCLVHFRAQQPLKMSDELRHNLFKTCGVLTRGFGDGEQRVTLDIPLDEIMEEFRAPITLLEVFTFGTLLVE